MVGQEPPMLEPQWTIEKLSSKSNSAISGNCTSNIMVEFYLHHPQNSFSRTIP